MFKFIALQSRLHAIKQELIEIDVDTHFIGKDGEHLDSILESSELAAVNNDFTETALTNFHN